MGLISTSNIPDGTTIDSRDVNDPINTIVNEFNGNIDLVNTSDAFLLNILQSIYPVGCIYTSVNSANPNSVFGFGTWEAFGSGRVPVGVDSADADFNTVEKTGGLKTTRHAYMETGLNTNNFQDGGTNYLTSVTGDIDAWLTAGSSSTVSRGVTVRNVGGTVGTNGTTGTEVRHARYTAPNLQPYIAVYMFKRTA